MFKGCCKCGYCRIFSSRYQVRSSQNSISKLVLVKILQKNPNFFLCLGSCECGVCEWFCEGTRKLWPGDLMLTAAQISTPLLPEICLNWFWFYSLIYKQNWCRNLGTNFPSNGFRIVLEFLILWWIC